MRQQHLSRATDDPRAWRESLITPLTVTQCFGLNKVREKGQIEAALAARSAAVYADYLLPHLRADMIVLDLGCGSGNDLHGRRRSGAARPGPGCRY